MQKWAQKYKGDGIADRLVPQGDEPITLVCQNLIRKLCFERNQRTLRYGQAAAGKKEGEGTTCSRSHNCGNDSRCQSLQHSTANVDLAADFAAAANAVVVCLGGNEEGGGEHDEKNGGCHC